MSVTRSKLKIAKEALGKKNYSLARETTSQILECEPNNYNANIFMGLACMELGDFQQSEQAYRTAINSNKEQSLAWQGLSKLYERTESWNMFADALFSLMETYNHRDPAKCVEAWQRLVQLRRERGSKPQLVEVLSYGLPEFSSQTSLSSTISNTISGAQTATCNCLSILEEITQVLEAHELNVMTKEVENRRSRLGAAGPKQIRNEVGREIWSASQLPLFYNKILNHPDTSDEERRLVESKLLRYKEQHLLAIPATSDFNSEKSQIRDEMDELVNGAILLRIPDELAWVIFLEGQDNKSISAYDQELVQQFLRLFPGSPLSTLLEGYLSYFGITVGTLTEKCSEGESQYRKETTEDPFDVILNAYAMVPDHLIANRAIAEVYMSELDYGNAVGAAENALKIVGDLERNSWRSLPKVRNQLKVILAYSLVHLHPPKHHIRALSIIDDVLSHFPEDTLCLMSRGYIFEEAEEWGNASTYFSNVGRLLPGDVDEGLRAREEVAWCSYQLGHLEVAMSGLLNVLEALEKWSHRSPDTARCLWRIGQCCWQLGDDRREEAYSFYIKSLRAHPSYAPAFTSLGIYYSEFSTPRDLKRASKCFQKAFELDPGECDAAERLASGLADEQEWELVEVIARRVIVGEGGSLVAGLNGSGPKTSKKYLSKQLWAWKATGAVEFYRGNYDSAIHAFQASLTAEPTDVFSWLHLGEAYIKAGRHISAVKALEHGKQLQPDNWLYSYFLGDVNYNVGNFNEAVSSFESILKTRPHEVGVLLMLCRAQLAKGESELLSGLLKRGELSTLLCISSAITAIRSSPGYRSAFWKIIGDAIFRLSGCPFISRSSVTGILERIAELLPVDCEYLSSFIRHPSTLLKVPHQTEFWLFECAAAVCSYRISLNPSETFATSGDVWFDLGICLLSRLFNSKDPETKIKTAEKVQAHFNRAIQDDPRSETFWAGLGNAYFFFDSKMSQHAYIRALELNTKDFSAWTNLGLLYFHYNDFELASDAFSRAKILDSENVVAWIGQALLIDPNDQLKEVMTLIEYSSGLTKSIPGADYEFAWRLFSSTSKKPQLYASEEGSAEALLPSFFILDRYCRYRPDDSAGLHLFGLVCERFGHFEVAASLVSQAISNLESTYERTEDPEIEHRFCVANITLGRLCLAVQDYARSRQAYGSALGLLGDSFERGVCAQAQLGLGVACCMQGELDLGMRNFRTALQSSASDVTLSSLVNLVLAQIMWDMATNISRESAKTQLLECIAADPENPELIITLAGMGILTSDDSLIDAALSEVMVLPLEKRQEFDRPRDVDWLLSQYYLEQANFSKAISVLQSALFVEPFSVKIRKNLGILMIQKRHVRSAIAVLSGFPINIPFQMHSSSLYFAAIARSLAGDFGKIPAQGMQKAIMLSPWDIQYWEGLAIVRGGT